MRVVARRPRGSPTSGYRPARACGRTVSPSNSADVVRLAASRARSSASLSAIGRQPQGQRFVLVETRRDQFAQAQARSKLPATRDTNVSPAIVTSGQPAHSASLAVVCAFTGKVSRNKSASRCRARCSAGGKRGANTNRSGGNASRLGFAAQVVGGKTIAFQQPQHAAGNRAEQLHPHVKHLGRDLVGVVETAEDEPLLRQAALGPRGRVLGNLAPAVVRPGSSRASGPAFP